MRDDDDDNSLIAGEGNASQRGTILSMLFSLLEREDLPRPEISLKITDDGRTLMLDVRDGGDRFSAAFRFAEPVAEAEFLRCLIVH